MKNIFLFLLPAAVLLGCTKVPVAPRGLNEAYADCFKVGVALNTHNLDSLSRSVVLREFGSVTCENAMKPGEIHPAADVWRFEGADSIVNFCRENHLPMRGHCLCWHNQFAMWMLTDSLGQPVSKEVFYERLREHIHTVVNRYKDVVYCWDVVNEAIADEPGECPYRRSFLYDLCGEEFIAKAFEFAHEADPDALLFYNDYNTFQPVKRDRIAKMIRQLKADGVPVHGIGMQGHYCLEGPAPEEVQQAIDTFRTIVDHLQITELDLRISREFGGQLEFSKEGRELTPEVIRRHAEAYRDMFEMYRRNADALEVVTFWNLSDRDSWVGTANWPLLFDADLEKKAAYDSVFSFPKQ